jgi:hypothetical protein
MQDWQAQALAWCDGVVERTGPVTSRLRPWSSVMEVPTARGPAWYKAASPSTSFEIGLYDVLPALVPERVLIPLALDLERGWVLLPDGGKALGDQLPEAPAVEAMIATLPAYGALQRTSPRTPMPCSPWGSPTCARRRCRGASRRCSS